MRRLSLIAAVTISLVLSACASSVKLDDAAGKTTTSAPTGAASVDPRNVATVALGVTDPLNDPAGVLAKRSVYFDYDSYAIKNEFKSVVEAHSNYLNGHKDRKIIIQGNTDERGGTEYNLALGQKRAEALRKAFSMLGVTDNQMEAVSFGKEKPRATGSDEASWAENRRADIVYQ